MAEFELRVTVVGTAEVPITSDELRLEEVEAVVLEVLEGVT